MPILPALAHWLKPHAKEKGRIVPDRAPHKIGKTFTSITAQLGELVGGWKPNALRHSFISYRAAIVGLGQTAMEAGNSESEARRSYNDAKTQAEAEDWFAFGSLSEVAS